MALDRELPSSARCVIIGGGVGGTSIAYHLAQLGYEDVVLLDRNQLTSGSTFHSAGLVGQLRGSVSLTRMMMYSVELYRRLGDESEFDPGWTECGGIRLASSEERMEELRRQAGWAKTFGLPMELISAEEAQGAVPADVDRRGARRGAASRPTATSTPRSSPTRWPTARGAAACACSPRRRVTGIDGRGRPGAGRADRARRHRVRGGGERGRHVRRGDRPHGGGARAGRADVPRVPRHAAVPRARSRRTRCPPCATPTSSSTTARRAAGW